MREYLGFLGWLRMGLESVRAARWLESLDPLTIEPQPYTPHHEETRSFRLKAKF